MRKKQKKQRQTEKGIRLARLKELVNKTQDTNIQKSNPDLTMECELYLT